eukprot:TRINITY_DN13280_c0_g1_i1.p1 TRINITY_DN13280_c0_g1~~TRINITY_DN13280_c0_g1_i1.p1  ORF type:complete len:207 (-),score=42.70 TRINITY_DN13280_c0_g1_i1:63-683(-)
MDSPRKRRGENYSWPSRDSSSGEDAKQNKYFISAETEAEEMVVSSPNSRRGIHQPIDANHRQFFQRKDMNRILEETESSERMTIDRFHRLFGYLITGAQPSSRISIYGRIDEKMLVHPYSTVSYRIRDYRGTLSGEARYHYYDVPTEFEQDNRQLDEGSEVIVFGYVIEGPLLLITKIIQNSDPSYHCGRDASENMRFMLPVSHGD